ncbi:MAG: hypothetical protein EOO52_12940 [Gammaproteobacteria bacterium]|nr:MAG: hypothetical protein EOO52_12940 [Gammaproteobacteria bacterium]
MLNKFPGFKIIAIVFALLCATNTLAAKSGSGTKSPSFSSGFKPSPSRNASKQKYDSRQKASPSPTVQHRASETDKPTTKTRFGTFGVADDARSTYGVKSLKPDSSLMSSMETNTARVNALRTYDARKVAAAAAAAGVVTGGLAMSESKSPDDTKIQQNAESVSRSTDGNLTHQSNRVPMPSSEPEGKHSNGLQDSMVVPAIAGYMAGRLSDDDRSVEKPRDVSNSMVNPTAAPSDQKRDFSRNHQSTAEPSTLRKGDEEDMSRLGIFFGTIFLGVCLYLGFRLLPSLSSHLRARLNEAKRQSYTLE